MEKLITAKNIDTTGDLFNYHQQIIEKYKNMAPDAIKAMGGNDAPLSPFNGYYTLEAPGSFFAIDTNMLIVGTSQIPTYFTNLLISVDGKTSATFQYTGTFDGSILQQYSDGLEIDLTFTRTGSSDGSTAECSGTITLPGQAPTNVTGSTYNNPIPATLFSGKYYESMGASEIVSKPLLQIKDNYEILYNDAGGNLQQVLIYVYNFNMYFFTALTADLQAVLFIMGSAAEGGLACNNIIVASKTSKSLQTVPYPSVTKLVSPNINSEQLAAFSGYYQLPSIATGAFISIEGEYFANTGKATIYRVKIGVSMDGISANGYYFEAANMTFIDNTLKMPVQSISITFDRTYDPANQSLVTITGNISGHDITGAYTLFNPVPLTVFGGATMTDGKGHSLTIVSDTEVTYDGVKMDSIIYVPIMYILANPTDSPTTEMSFGTDGLKGNACIITDSTGIVVVDAILNP